VTANVLLVNRAVGDNRGRIGGGITVESGSGTPSGTSGYRNVARGAGGIRLGPGTLAPTSSSIRRTISGSSGGGIFADTVTPTSSTTSANSAGW
jgi:hypothetical protein